MNQASASEAAAAHRARADRHRRLLPALTPQGFRRVLMPPDVHEALARWFREHAAEAAPEDHHDHLIDLKSGEVIEFVNEEIEKLQAKIAEKLGYKLVAHRLELYGVPDQKKAQ